MGARWIVEFRARKVGSGGPQPDRRKDPAKVSRVGKLGHGTGAKERSRALHLSCCDPDLDLLIQISYLDLDLRRQPCPAKRCPGHGTLGADPTGLGNLAEGNLCLGLLPMLEEESLGSY